MVSHQEGSDDFVHYVRRSFGFVASGSLQCFDRLQVGDCWSVQVISAGLGAAERVPDRSMVSVDRSPRLWQGTVLSGPIRASGGPVRKLFGWEKP